MMGRDGIEGGENRRFFPNALRLLDFVEVGRGPKVRDFPHAGLTIYA